jgi:hypothetical protein
MMFDPFSSWSRLMAAGFSMANTSMRAIETMGASNEVITARTKIINAAVCSPLTGDHAELGRMVPEKVDAFSQAGSATVAAWWGAQSMWMGHMQHFSGMVMSGRLPTPAEITDLGQRTAALTLESIEATARLGSATLAPVHRKATSNAKRLNRKTTRAAR